MTTVSGVRVVAWNPRRRVARRGPLRRVGLPARVDNFGDLIGPLVVRRMLGDVRVRRGRSRARLLTVGSILHLARPGDVVWGTGRNGKVPADRHERGGLDVRAVRGPSTRAFLAEQGVDAPAVYGDPALLLPLLVPELRDAAGTKRYARTHVPNLNDHAAWSGDPDVLAPTAPLRECLERVVRSEFVYGSSLHGVIVAEAFGVPAMFAPSQHEDVFKYHDYLSGTGRPEAQVAGSVAEARAGHGYPPPAWDPAPLLAAFPWDLWGVETPPGREVGR